MHFHHQTPESLLGRSDSKNPATTCRGLTTNGKPCRRAIAKSFPGGNNGLQQGVVAVVRTATGDLSDAAFYCWQHKDQADAFAKQTQSPQMPSLLPVQERTSIDSLVASLGITSLDDRSAPRTQHGMTLPGRGPTYSTPTRQSRLSGHTGAPRPQYQRPSEHSHRRQQPAKARNEQTKRAGFWTSLCCMTRHSDDDGDDYLEIVRHRKRVDEPRVPEMTMSKPAGPRIQSFQDVQERGRSNNHREGQHIPNVSTRDQRMNPPSSHRRPLAELSTRAPSNQRIPSSPTQSLLSYIPPHLSPQTTSILLTELSKPISPHDEEGFIYIFWLTESSHAPPPKEAATYLLAPPTMSRPRRPSDVMSDYSSPDDRTSGPRHAANKTIKLKIGRANNVHRRMNEWTRQCGHDLSLVRWYPYAGPSSSPSSSPTRRSPTTAPTASSSPVAVRKVPCVHKVERLVHLELADKRIKRGCAACGKEHREWFEVEASETGVRAVDEVVRRWVRWAETAGV